MTTPAVGQVYRPCSMRLSRYECIGIAYFPDYASTPGPQIWLERINAYPWRLRVSLEKFQEGWEVADVPAR